MHVFLHRTTLPVWFLLMVTLSFFPPAAMADPDFKQCRRCHGATLEADTYRLYQHPVFTRGRCMDCHLPAGLKETLPPAQERATIAPESETIHWLGDSLLAATGHWFLMAGEDLRSTLVIETRGNRNFSRRWEQPVPPLAGVGGLEDSGRPPVISDLQVLEIRRGLFLSATIGWQTDNIAGAQVRYGVGAMNRTSPAHNRLGRRHRVVLNDLQPDQTYLYAAVSRDLFGREQVSETLTFTTTRPRITPLPSSSLSSTTNDGATAEPEVDFQQHGDNYLLQLTFQQPAMVAVGTSGPARLEEDHAAAGQEVPEEDHTMLNSQAGTTITACIQCHQGRLGIATHPVNVYPPPGMLIPPAYPTLADGRITCISCHQRHGSNNSYLLVKPGQRELCIGCHQNMR